MFRIIYIWLIALITFHNVSNAQSHYWQQKLHYDISVQLNDTEHTLDGFIRINYLNNSDDTLKYIWFHLWPNAYKNDQTAFCDQLLENGKTAFYFSENNERGYINKLDFRLNGSRINVEDHPQHIDIVKLLLPSPILPGDSAQITTPFHVKLPKNFSRGGHVGRSYQIAQWYPKPAVYDRDGWHPMPYLDQGEFYAEYGSYNVTITLPVTYRVLTSGVLQNTEDDLYIKNDANNLSKQKGVSTIKDTRLKTLIYEQNNIHDFAWFASKELEIIHDSMVLPSGKILQLRAGIYPKRKQVWEKGLQFTKEALLQRSRLIGEYAYDHFSFVEVPGYDHVGMEYPCIATISSNCDPASFEEVIRHEVGHSWFQGMIGNNERAFPWLDEGINTYYDRRFTTPKRISKKFNIINDYDEFLLRTYQELHLDQPINTSSEIFSENNYWITAYYKSAKFLELIEAKIGREAFDAAMRNYFDKWRFAHPYPEDFFSCLKEQSIFNLDTLFGLINKKGSLAFDQPKKKISYSLFPGYFSDAKYHWIATPIPAYNITDGVMVGAAFSNYNLPPTRFQWLAAPLYGLQSGDLNYVTRFSYTWFPKSVFGRIHLSLSGMKFNTNTFADTAGKKYITGFRKWAPGIKFVFRNTNPRSTKEKYFQWKTFFINEGRLRFLSDTFPNGNRYLQIFQEQSDRYLHQLQYVIQDSRALYPYHFLFQAERSDLFTRLSTTAHYYLNYNQKEGIQVRMFAGKFIYNVERNIKNISAANPFHLNLTGPRGQEDYTYSNYFIGRNEFDGLASQQIMMRDGGFKIRTDLLADKVGKTDDWLMSVNFVSDIPEKFNPLKILPFDIPLKLFLDIGTYANLWQPEFEGSRILYNAGLQLPLLKNTIQVYIPLLYSSVYRDYLSSVVRDNIFLKSISFSIDLQQFRMKNLDKRLPF